MASDAQPDQDQDKAPPLGLAGNTARMFIQSPLSPLLFFAMLAMGVLGLMLTPRQEDPQISVPLIDIFLSYPGASAEQVAARAVEPLERIMSEIPGIKHVYSASQREGGVVTVRFKVGEEAGPSLVKVHDKLQSNLDRIPTGVKLPLVKAKGIDDVPILSLTLWSATLDGGELRKLAVNIQQSLNQVPDVGQSFLVGGRAEQIRIDVQPDRLAGYDVTLDQVASTIRSANSEAGVGAVEKDNHQLAVYAGGYLRTPDDVGSLVIGTRKGVPVYVRDIARVYSGLEDPRYLVSYTTGPAYEEAHGEAQEAYGEQAVTIALAKKQGSNAVSVVAAVLDKVETLKGLIIPEGVHIEITRNYGESAEEKVNELLFKLVVATLIVTVLVWFALGFRPALVVTMVIPVVILMTVFAAFVLGFTIDRVSLFALIFSIGILVDDAIVVLENIYRRWLMRKETDVPTAVDAVREVGNPTILATFTVVAALLPMAFVRGLMGPYMAPIPVLGSVAMLISLFAAFAFTSWLTLLMKPSMRQLQRMGEKEHAAENKLDRVFHVVLVPLINNRLYGWVFLVGLIVAFLAVCLMFYTTAVPVKMLPFDNKPEFSIVLDMPEGSALADTDSLAGEIVDAVTQIPEVTAVQTYEGTAEPFDFNGMVRHYYLRDKPWQAQIHVQLLGKTERERTSHEIAEAVRAQVTPLAEARQAAITIAEMPPGPPVLQTVVAEVYGPDAETRRQVVKDLTEIFRETPGLADVDNYLQAPHEVVRFEIDTQKAVRSGVSVDTIIRNLALAMGGRPVDEVKAGTALEPIQIAMEVPLAVRRQTGRLIELPMPRNDGTVIPLGELGRFIEIPQDPIIYHKDLRPVDYVVGDAVGRLNAPIYPMLKVQERLKDYRTPDGVTLSGTFTGPPPDDGRSSFEWGGEWTVTYETFRDMGMAFMIALVMIYMLVVGMFGNFIVPAIIMAPIPLTLLGIVPGHWLLDAKFTATSMIGFIALAGIIVRNSILLVDFAIQEVRNGAPVREAVVTSCKARTRPIMITALALVGGSSVILTDPIFQGMAVSLLFGVIVSTLLTLIVIPLGCVSAGSHLYQPTDAELAAARDKAPHRPAADPGT